MTKTQIAFLIAFGLSLLFYLLPRKEYESVVISEPSITLPTGKVHIFYDASFRNKTFDGAFLNWYTNSSTEKYDAAFYPELGLYSSKDPKVIDLHMKQIQSTGVGVVVVSWWPDDFERSPPMSLILEHAQKYGLKVTVHIQNYPNRTLHNLMTNFVKILKMYDAHPAFYKLKVPSKKRPLPLIYIYEPLAFNPNKWNLLLSSTSNFTIRETRFDALFIGLIVEDTDQYVVTNSNFDGFYTWLSLCRSTYASTWYNWPYIQDFARDRGLIFIPSVSPGYDYRLSSDNINPRLIPPRIARNSGMYYNNAWSRAVVSRSKFVAINSFNGWLEGTQIEPAETSEKAYTLLKTNFEDYTPENSDVYLQMTREWVIEFSNRSLYRP
ncbi:hypothetical protein ILUMI_07404 [Ignelater luminosus]|uniref:Glycoprotein endo-alpha-1,2-mannosidase n=1 Tax=Ignelater luminosus TaxID=2038154 RepID=A0A8K0GGW7_IGNLU|nr:hypothetical protein ILUMI_07404 [Ignelater luminosus]